MWSDVLLVQQGLGATSKHHTKNSYSGWNKRGRRGYPSEYEGRLNQWDEGKLSDSAMDNEAATDESQGCDCTEDVEEVAQAPKASDSALQSCWNCSDSSTTVRDV